MFESGAQPSNSAVEIRNVEPEAYSAEDDVEIGHQRLAPSLNLSQVKITREPSGWLDFPISILTGGRFFPNMPAIRAATAVWLLEVASQS